MCVLWSMSCFVLIKREQYNVTCLFYSRKKCGVDLSTLSLQLLARHASYNRALPKPKKIVCEIERLREKETFFKGISVERSFKKCAKRIPNSKKND